MWSDSTDTHLSVNLLVQQRNTLCQFTQLLCDDHSLDDLVGMVLDIKILTEELSECLCTTHKH